MTCNRNEYFIFSQIKFFVLSERKYEEANFDYFFFHCTVKVLSVIADFFYDQMNLIVNLIDLPALAFDSRQHVAGQINPHPALSHSEIILHPVSKRNDRDSPASRFPSPSEATRGQRRAPLIANLFDP